MDELVLLLKDLVGGAVILLASFRVGLEENIGALDIGLAVFVVVLQGLVVVLDGLVYLRSILLQGHL